MSLWNNLILTEAEHIKQELLLCIQGCGLKWICRLHTPSHIQPHRQVYKIHSRTPAFLMSWKWVTTKLWVTGWYQKPPHIFNWFGVHPVLKCSQECIGRVYWYLKCWCSLYSSCHIVMQFIYKHIDYGRLAKITPMWGISRALRAHSCYKCDINSSRL